MDVYECIRTRRTVREFKPDPVPDEIVHTILQAGRWAPSSSNTQPWHFVVVRNRETIAAIGRHSYSRGPPGGHPSSADRVGPGLVASGHQRCSF